LFENAIAAGSEKEAMTNALMSWYMAGYHTGTRILNIVVINSIILKVTIKECCIISRRENQENEYNLDDIDAI
jgi:hypothetical protein